MSEMMEALQALAAEKGISVDTLMAALADALESAYKRMPGAHEYAWVTIDPTNFDIRVYAQEIDEDGARLTGDLAVETQPGKLDALEGRGKLGLGDEFDVQIGRKEVTPQHHSDRLYAPEHDPARRRRHPGLRSRPGAGSGAAGQHHRGGDDRALEHEIQRDREAVCWCSRRWLRGH